MSKETTVLSILATVHPEIGFLVQRNEMLERENLTLRGAKLEVETLRNALGGAEFALRELQGHYEALSGWYETARKQREAAWDEVDNLRRQVNALEIANEGLRKERA